ncbi:MAG: glycosyltransferase family 4 protein, partial [Nitrospirae bacterium]|nr:glycosyltransferase family 4 protein [Nitrospirota bacterium]
VIATSIGGIPEVVDDGKTGIIIPPGNVNALCEAIKLLIQNPGIRLQMGKNGRVRVLEKFTVEQNVRKTEDVFLSLLEI